jgi:hypothetical protein
MMNYDTYRVTVSREEPRWVAAIDGVGTAEATNIAELEPLVRDLIMVTHDLDGPDFDLAWDYELPAEAAEALQVYLRSRQEREEVERRYLQDAGRAALALDAAHVSAREAAQLMHLSQQRVEQLRSRGGTW